jgi:hypothetical protein
MDLREALYTTRAMRRVTTEPIPSDVQQRILDAAVRAPSGGNAQNWRFLLVDDPAVRADLAPLYRACLTDLWGSYYAPRIEAAAANPDSEESKQFLRIKASADHLADHFADVPLLLFGFAQHDPSGGSIFPAPPTCSRCSACPPTRAGTWRAASHSGIRPGVGALPRGSPRTR